MVRFGRVTPYEDCGSFTTVFRGRQPTTGPCSHFFPMERFKVPISAAPVIAKRIYSTAPQRHIEVLSLDKNNPVMISAAADFLITNRDWVLRSWATMEKGERHAFLMAASTFLYAVGCTGYTILRKMYNSHIEQKAKEMVASSAPVVVLNLSANQETKRLAKRMTKNEKAIKEIQALQVHDRAAAQVGLYRFPVRTSSSSFLRSIVNGNVQQGFNPLMNMIKADKLAGGQGGPRPGRARRAPAGAAPAPITREDA